LRRGVCHPCAEIRESGSQPAPARGITDTTHGAITATTVAILIIERITTLGGRTIIGGIGSTTATTTPITTAIKHNG
jgi:hypothetical protein